MADGAAYSSLDRSVSAGRSPVAFVHVWNTSWWIVLTNDSGTGVPEASAELTGGVADQPLQMSGGE